MVSFDCFHHVFSNPKDITPELTGANGGPRLQRGHLGLCGARLRRGSGPLPRNASRSHGENWWRLGDWENASFASWMMIYIHIYTHLYYIQLCVYTVHDNYTYIYICIEKINNMCVHYHVCFSHYGIDR